MHMSVCGAVRVLGGYMHVCVYVCKWVCVCVNVCWERFGAWRRVSKSLELLKI